MYCMYFFLQNNKNRTNNKFTQTFFFGFLKLTTAFASVGFVYRYNTMYMHMQMNKKRTSSSLRCHQRRKHCRPISRGAMQAEPYFLRRGQINWRCLGMEFFRNNLRSSNSTLIIVQQQSMSKQFDPFRFYWKSLVGRFTHI